MIHEDQENLYSITLGRNQYVLAFADDEQKPLTASRDSQGGWLRCAM
jgi:hypothetical protein